MTAASDSRRGAGTAICCPTAAEAGRRLGSYEKHAAIHLYASVFRENRGLSPVFAIWWSVPGFRRQNDGSIGKLFCCRHGDLLSGCRSSGASARKATKKPQPRASTHRLFV
jgi:hypothetical protein